MIKIAIMLQQTLSKENFKDVCIGITQGICYNGLLGTENSIEFRTIGQCITKACALSGSPSCKKKILIDDALVSDYLEVTGCDFFISNEVELQSNTYIIQPKSYKPSFMECHELFSMSAGITSSCLNLWNSNDRIFRLGFEKNPGLPKWRQILQSFVDNNDPKVVLIEGTPGMKRFIKNRLW